jgi:hypothetical protein
MDPAELAAFEAALRAEDIGESSTCCVLALSRAYGPPHANDLGAIARAYNAKLSTSPPYVIELSGFVAVIVYCTLRTRVFLPTGVDSRWQLRNFKASAGHGRQLSDLVRRHGRPVDAVAAQDPRVLTAAQSPSRIIGGGSPAAPASPFAREPLQRAADAERAFAPAQTSVRELLQRVAGAEGAARAAEARAADAEGIARAAEARVAAVEERCKVAETEHLRLRAEVQFLRATGRAALSAAQKQPPGADLVYPRG